VIVAGLRGMTYGEDGRAAGSLVLLDMLTGQMIQVRTAGPVSEVRWATR
jgi:hypothetical protein